MKRTLLVTALIGATLASACTVPDPVVSDYNGASVRVQVSMAAVYASEADKAAYGQKARAQAVQVCSVDGHTDAQYVSIRQINDYFAEALFICK